MSVSYPDVNKYGANDANLCWAAATANALTWTGWNQEMARSSGLPELDEDGIYDCLRFLHPRGRGNLGWRPLPAIDWLLKRFNVRVPTINVAQWRSAHDVFLCESFLGQRDHQCAIFEIAPVNPKADGVDDDLSHVITVYEAENDLLIARNDPRAAKEAFYYDSDDNQGNNRYIHIKQKGAFREYDKSKQLGVFQFLTENVSNVKNWYLMSWMSIKANPNAVFH